tara:strand:- start:214 stop:1059 length:846 start_codon:yes stop_codon:yes gene_type:complete
MSRIPGNFTHQHIGQRKKVHTGWRTFDPFAPDAVSNDPNSMVSAMTIDAAGQIQFTLTDAITGQDHAHTMAVYAIPLKDKNGKGITFADSFIVQTQNEFISSSGNLVGTNQHDPVWGMAIGQRNTDIHAASAHINYLATGFHIKTASTDTPKFHIWHGKRNGSTAYNSGAGSSKGLNTKHLVSNYYVGPCVGSASQDTDTVWSHSWFGQNATGSYEKHTSAILSEEVANVHGVFDVDTQVYLWAFFGCEDDADGSNDPAVITCRLKYMVNANPGKLGTGAA